MKTTKLRDKLIEAGFIVTTITSDIVCVSICDDVEHQSTYAKPCAEAVVLPLLAFCARHNIQMHREGGICKVEI